MRFVPLAIIFVILAGIGYVSYFHYDYLSRTLRGYHAAETPAEAMAYFTRAIKERDYSTAALYCTGAYADYLVKADVPAHALGRLIDRVMHYMKDKGLEKDSTFTALYLLDPFPPYFSTSGTPKVDADNPAVAHGIFIVDDVQLDLGKLAELGDSIDQKMFNQVLAPWTAPQTLVRIERVDDGESKTWKLSMPLPKAKSALIDYYLARCKDYEQAFSSLSLLLTNERPNSSRLLESEVFRTIREAKG